MSCLKIFLLFLDVFGWLGFFWVVSGGSGCFGSIVFFGLFFQKKKLVLGRLDCQGSTKFSRLYWVLNVCSAVFGSLTLFLDRFGMLFEFHVVFLLVSGCYTFGVVVL